MSLQPVPDLEDADGEERPRHLISSCPGWAYSLGDDGRDRGVYRLDRAANTWAWVAPLPEVTDRLTDRDGDGGRMGMRYRLVAPDGTAAVVSRKELADGVWAGKLDLPLPPGKNAVEAAAAAVIDLAYATTEAREAVPGWVDGELRLPPSEAGLVGYAACAANEERARKAWSEIAPIIRKSPKLVLLMGAAFAGLFSKPLRRQIHWWEMVGGGRQGKSTATMMCAATLGWSGDPEVMDGILKPLSSTPQGLLQELRSLGVLPAVYDETGSIATRNAAQREELLFTLFTGNKKGMGVRPGETPYRTAGYHSTVLSSGNTSLSAGIGTEGILSKIITVRTPITEPSPGLVGEEAEADASADADRLRELAPLAYGWPLAWLLRSGPDVDRVRSILARAEAELPLPPGGVAQTIGRHMALAVTGAVLLSELIDQELTDVAMGCAQQLLAARMEELEEQGLTPADRLLSAVREAMAARPRCFPEVETYRAFVNQTVIGGEIPVLPTVIDGFVLEDGAVGMLPRRLNLIAEEAGIGDIRPGLEGARADGRLVVKAKKGMQSPIRIRKKPGRQTDVYLLRVVDEDQEQEPATGTEPAPERGTEAAGNGTEPPRERKRVRTSDLGVPFPENEGLTCEDTPHSEAGNGGNGTPAKSYIGEAGTDVRSPVAEEVRTPSVPAPEEGQEQAEILSLAGTPDTLTTHDGREIEIGSAYDDMAAFLRRVLELMPSGGTVTVDVPLAKALGMGSKPWIAPDPKAPKSRKKPTPAPACVASAQEAGWRPGSRGVLGCTTWSKAGVRTAVTVLVPAWTEATVDALEINGRQLLADDVDAQSAAYRAGRFAELTGTPWVMTGGTSITNLAVGDMFAGKHPVRLELRWSAPIVEFPRVKALSWQAEAEGGLLALPEWAKALGMHVHAYDARAAYLAAMGRTQLSRTGLQHTGPATPIDEGSPGYWLIPEPEGGFRLPCGIPILTKPGNDGHVWVTTPEACFLLELDLIDVHDAVDSWTVPDHTVTNRRNGKKRRVRDGARLLQDTANTIRDALLAIPEGTADPDEAAVRTVVKAGFSEFIGQMKKDTGLIWRSDWRDQIIATANTTILRRVHHTWLATGGEDGGVVPVRLNTDAVYYATREQDAEVFRPEEFPVDEEWRDRTGRFELGKFKVDLSGPAGSYMKGEL